MRDILARWPLAPFLAGLNLFIPYAAGNIAQLEPYEIGVVAAVVLGFVLALTLLLRRVVGSWPRAAMCGTTVLYVLFLLPPAIAKPGEAGVLGWLVMLSAIGLTGFFIVQSRRSGSDYRLANIVVNSLLIGLLVVPTMAIAQFSYGALGSRPAPNALFPDIPSTGKAADGPDIWHFVFDRYAGAETLRDVYGYDNEPFLAALRSRGFSVADAAAANYQRTAHSLASTLNFDFLDVFAAQDAMMQDDLLPLYRSIRNNRVTRFLQAQDYRLIHFGPWWEPTRRSDLADTHVNYLDMPDFLRLTLERSIVSHVAAATGMMPGDGRSDQCRRVQFQFDALEQLAREDKVSGRKQVFAHLLLPHPPFIVKADGACKSLAEARALSRIENYVAQVTYANQRILALLDEIAASGRPAVVIVQADEGPWPEALAGDEASLGLDTSNADWATASDKQLHEKMFILLAVKGIAPGDLPLDPRATPVNLYRQIFARYFGSALPLLPDRSFLFKDRSHPYQFIDVTDRLH